MKALLLKDTSILMKQMKLFFLLIVLLSIVPGFSSAGFAIVYAALLPVTAMSYDERAKWDKLAVMMPFTPKELVVSKFLLGYLSIGAATLVCIIGQYAGFMFRSGTTIGMELIAELLIVVAVALVLMSVNLPLMFKLGVEKGRVAFLVLTVAVVISGVAYCDKFIERLDKAGSDVLHISVTALIVGIIVSLISMISSVKIYEAKEQ